jgi:hypothetical protein
MIQEMRARRPSQDEVVALAEALTLLSFELVWQLDSDAEGNLFEGLSKSDLHLLHRMGIIVSEESGPLNN